MSPWAWTLLKWVGAALLILWLALRWLERASLYHPTPVAGPDPGAYGLPFETAQLKGLEGHSIRAWFIPGRGPVTVLYSGGNGESAAAVVSSAEWRRMMQELGVNVLVWDYPGYGGSRGQPSEASLYAGARAALDHLRTRPGVDPGRIVAWGHSLGSFVAAELGATEPVAAVVLQAPPASVLEAGREVLGPVWHLARLMPGLPRDPHDTLAKVRQIQAPLLILHGTADEVVSVRHGRLLASAREGIRYVEIPGATHMSPWWPGDPVQFEAFRAPLARFFGEVERRPAPEGP